MRISLPVEVTVLPVPANFTPPNTMQGLLQTIPKYMDIEMEDNGPAILASTTPPTDLTGVWLQLQSAPEPPEAMVFYNGAWRQIFSGNPNEVRIFDGDPTVQFDGTGLGLVGGDWDGWALCNGANGTVNLQNEFVVPGYKFNKAPSTPAGWVTNINGTSDLHTGGAAQFQIQLANLPALFVSVNTKLGYISTSNVSTGVDSSNPGQSGTVNGLWNFPFTNQAQMVQTPISQLPPFIAVGYAQFVGYA